MISMAHLTIGIDHLRFLIMETTYLFDCRDVLSIAEFWPGGYICNIGTNILSHSNWILNFILGNLSLVKVYCSVKLKILLSCNYMYLKFKPLEAADIVLGREALSLGEFSRKYLGGVL